MFFTNVRKICSVAILVSIFICVYSKIETKTGEDILFGENKRVPVTLKLLNETTGNVMNLHFSIDEKMLSENNYTIEDIDQRFIRKTVNGSYEIKIRNNETFPITLATEQIINFSKRDKNDTFQLSTYGLMTKTVEDLDDDPSLQPVNQSRISWPSQQICEEMKLKVNVTPNGFTVILNNQTIAETVSLNQSNFSATWYNNQGLTIVVINPWTCKVTFSQFIKTVDFGFFRDAIWILDTISSGRLVLLMSLGGASIQLHEAREKIKVLGSSWAEYFYYRDGWLSTFFSRGKFVSEILIPNSGGFKTAGSPFITTLDIPRQHTSPNASCYLKWPTNEEWNRRKEFCEAYDGFARLCDCENPFILRSKNDTSHNKSKEVLQIPLLISTGNRTRQLYRLLESLGTQDGITKESFLIFSNNEFEQTKQLLFILGLEILLHKSEVLTVLGQITNNLQFGLYQGLKLFPDAKYFIFLEEDLVLAPDFYAYMQHFAPIFELDDSIFCVSAFNHLSYPHTSKYPSKAYRVKSYPAYGWMMSRAIIEYIVPKFLPHKIDQDWDYYIGSDLISKNMETVVPDINRSYHWALGGIHNKGSLLAEESYLCRNINNETYVKYIELESLVKSTYEKNFVEELKRAELLNVTEDLINFTTPLQKGKIYKLFVRKQNNGDIAGFQLIGEMLRIWFLDERDHHNHAWRLNYMDAILFVIGIPISPYKKFMDKGTIYLNPASKSYLQEHYEDAYSSVQVSTHFNNYYLPKFFYTFNETTDY